MRPAVTIFCFTEEGRIAMQKLACLTLSLVAMSGCIIVEDDPGSGCPALEAGACLSVVVTGCPESVARYDVYTIDPADTEGFFEANFGCNQIGIVLVDPGVYDMRIEAEGDDQLLYSADPVIELEVDDLEIVELTYDFPVGKGFFWSEWTFETADGDPSECDNIPGATFVEIATADTSDVAPCHYLGWQTSELDLGEHDVTVNLLDDAGNVLATAGPIEGEVGNDSEIVDLTPVVFVEAPPE
jgi:hypothetical protein